jgi:hypothetical protein
LLVPSTEANPDSSSTESFFSGIHLGMSIEEAQRYYQKLSGVSALWHSDAPTGQEQVDFRTSTVPQRRVYVYYSQADHRILSVLYWKLGAGETFSQTERSHLIELNGNRKDLINKSWDDGSKLGSEFEVTTPQQFETCDFSCGLLHLHFAPRSHECSVSISNFESNRQRFPPNRKEP